MTDSLPQEALTPVKRALLEIRELKARLTRAESSGREPIAVVGIGCRFPGGADDPAAYWDLLSQGRDAIGPVPTDRWDQAAFYHPDPDHPGTMTMREGGFLTGVDQFDAELFGISPREAATMDPQQRLALEVAWSALEDASLAPDSLRGSRTGVFLGVGNSDYWRMVFADRSSLDAYGASGNSYAVAAGRISYFLGLHGPSLAVDTACSASLVAVHLACASLRSGECDRALAGGVNLILSPDANVVFTKARMLAADGRSKTFDAAADGYGRGEGCGFVVLRRLSDALRDGDRILATVRGSAVNHDGRSGGLTAPNGQAQQEVLRSALAAAGLRGLEVGYLEAHGTGTPLGDPIELHAAGAVYGAGRASDHPLIVGSCKTNFGHLEAAAGIAGLIKAILAVQHGVIPPHRNFATPNPHIDWPALRVRIPVATEAWVADEAPRRAGVSSFGFSGTNAHVIVEQAPDASVRETPLPSVAVLPLSARSEPALRQVADGIRTALDRGAPLGALCRTAALGRNHFEQRLAVPVESAGQLRAALDRIVATGEAAGAVRGRVEPGQTARVALVFSGQGTQHLGMGADAYHDLPVFRAAVDEVVREAGDEVGARIHAAITGADGADVVATGLAQPAIFAVQYALWRQLEQWGVEPAVVAGHSIGEYAAAVAAGVLSVTDATRLVVARGAAMQALPAGGAMAAVLAGEAALSGLDGVELAAINGPEQIVISGPAAAIDAACVALEGRGIRTKRLVVSHAFHSALMEPMIADFQRLAEAVVPQPARIQIVSTVTGALAGPEFGTAAYWTRQIRQPVRFGPAVLAARELGIDAMLDVGPHPALAAIAGPPASGETALAMIPTLRRGESARASLRHTLGALYVAGAPVRWDAVYAGPGAWVTLPGYPFERRRHWIETPAPATRPSTETPERRWDRTVAAARRQADQVPLGFRPEALPALWAALESVTFAHAQAVLSALGAFRDLAPGEYRPVAEVLRRTGIAPLYQHLVSRWLSGLAVRGVLTERQEGYRPAADRLDAPDLDVTWRQAEPWLAAEPALSRYLRNCGTRLEAVMRGAQSPLETLFPGGRPELAEDLYANTGPMRYANLIAAEVLAERLRSAGRPLRVLEIGAGTGGTTVATAPRLDPDTEYWFTDVSDLFLDRARERFGSYAGLRFAELDLERPLDEQNVQPESFDVVIATNAVHAVRNLAAGIDRLLELLAPDGVLVLVETIGHLAWFDMSTGLIEGWQHFEDSIRVDEPLLSGDRWAEVLVARGFEAAAVVPGASSPAFHGGQQVIIAHKRAGEASILPGVPGLVEAEGDFAAVGGAPEDGLVAQLRTATGTDRDELMLEYVRAQVAQVLRLPPTERLGRRHRLMDLGLDSLMAVQLRNRLATGLGLGEVLSATLMFDYPTIEAIARHLLEHLDPSTSQAGDAPATPAAPSRSSISEATLAEMTEEDADALLRSRLSELS